jgi:hypothetical protein
LLDYSIIEKVSFNPDKQLAMPRVACPWREDAGKYIEPEVSPERLFFTTAL